ncbi:MAG: protein translocase subunit SecD [Demequina sp.]
MSQVTRSARKSLIWLVVIVMGMYALLSSGVMFGNASATPGLALDLAGGRQIIMEAVTENDEVVTETDLQQAVEIIRRRVDASGVAEAEITTQGDTIIVVGLPGNPSQETVDLVRQSAQLQFRPVLVSGPPFPSGQNAPEPTVEPSSSPDASPSSPAWLTSELVQQFEQLDCTDPANLAGADLGDPDAGHVACAADGTAKYAMGPVELTGEDIETATSGPELNQLGNPTGFFAAAITFTGDGGREFNEIANRLFDLQGDRNRFAMVLDGVVISAPSVNQRNFDGEAQITGQFAQQDAELLANQLKFGALPLTLEVQTEEQVAATLGTSQLERGLLAGAIGLALVFMYSLIQYRALGLVTVSSLLIAAVSTYALIALLSWGMGYRLSLAGVAGLIVAVGITADSFIVYFERIRDELREGRSLGSAIDHAWRRARRTILASDLISLIAAITLYMLAVGGVRGFAFTLGLVTFVDVLVVFLFTHPVLVLLAKTKFFGDGHRLSGLDPRQLGREALYKGRGRVAVSRPASTSTMTLAERKAAAAKGEQ